MMSLGLDRSLSIIIGINSYSNDFPPQDCESRCRSDRARSRYGVPVSGHVNH